MDAELKPCPFCGGEAILIKPNSEEAKKEGFIGIRCKKYCIRMNYGHRSVTQQLIKDWNTRAVPPRTEYDMQPILDNLKPLEKLTKMANRTFIVCCDCDQLVEPAETVPCAKCGASVCNDCKIVTDNDGIVLCAVCEGDYQQTPSMPYSERSQPNEA